ncbi:amino acid adenylation domain-containing protein [Spirosoma aerolatum]|uniref:amino acid adenylation domain-containing protein n=1 Tax=Spirosoma aerolatum TaxID=1211326 RepID=UPI0009AE3C09|nr:amino acid adenylation domain-containing protein [Spirosoma aerolatum]
METSRQTTPLIPPLDYKGPDNLPFKALPTTSSEVTISRLFADQVACQPDRVAIVDGALSCTYAQLMVKTRQIAQALRACKLSPGAPVGLWMEKSVNAIAALLAVLAEGHPYVPFDLAMPAQRNASILSHAGVQWLIGYQSDLQKAPLSLNQLVIEDIEISDPDLPFDCIGGPDHLAYILYTSGTTGRPKGVYQNQRGVLHDVAQYVNSIHLGPLDRHTLLYSLSVIGSVRDVLGTLLTGGSMHLYHPTKQGLAGITDFLLTQQITVFHSLPLLFRGFLSVARKAYFPAIRLVYLAGDRIYRADVERYRASFRATARLYVGIGSTENTTLYRQWFLDHQTELDNELIPVGYAVPDRLMQLQDSDGHEVEVGEIGEIVVTSAYVALGYWNDDELTKKAFRPSGSQRTFRTGDLGRIRPDGLLEFIGRRDRQLKLSGYRVEPAEIEAVLLRAPGVSSAAILLREPVAHSCLVAYVTLQEGSHLASVRQFALDQLPAHMVPIAWEIIETLPVLSNFKIDYEALARLDAIRYEQQQTKQPHPQGASTEQVLRKIWCRYASAYSFDEDLSWRNGGGSSFNSLLLLIDLEEQFGCALPIDWFHNQMRPSQLHIQLQQRLTLSQTGQKESSVYFVVFRPLYGMREGTYQFIQQLRTIGTVQIIHYPDFAQQSRGTFSAQSFIGQIKAQFDHLPAQAHLVGICSGCIVAHEIAHWLAGINRPMGQLIYIDHPPAGAEMSWWPQLVDTWQNRSIHALPLRLLRTLSRPLYQRLIVMYTARKPQMYAEAFVHLMTRTTRPSSLCQPIILVQCADMASKYGNRLGWDRYVSGMHLIQLPYLHIQMFRVSNNLTSLVAQLNDLLSPDSKSVSY